MKNIKIYLKNHPNDKNGNLCNNHVKTAVKYPTNNNDYDCIPCTQYSSGSFLELLIEGKFFYLADIKVYGSLISERGIFLNSNFLVHFIIFLKQSTKC